MDEDALADLFAPAGQARIKRMFGGKGVYLDGVIVAVELSDGVLYLKGDAQTAPAYEAAGARRWVYAGETKDGAARRVAMPYWTMPDEAYDDEEALLRFVGLAREAARRAEVAKAGNAPKKPEADKKKSAGPQSRGGARKVP